MRQSIMLVVVVMMAALLPMACGAAAGERKAPRRPPTPPPPQQRAPPGHKVRDRVWHRPSAPLTVASVAALRAEAREMFAHAYGAYMRLAFPRDNLIPLAGVGEDWMGGVALTLIDALDGLLLLGLSDEVAPALAALDAALPAGFDVDDDAHVFETTIRALGGLLGAHVLLARNPGLVPGYDGRLLRLSEDLGARLLPAFNTPHGLPASFVNLRHGTRRASDNTTCTACAGTLLLEFGALSALTGNATYAAAAARAADALFARRSKRGLVGSVLHVRTGRWLRPEATIGPLADSYYEYALKAWLMTGDKGRLDEFVALYTDAMAAMALPPPPQLQASQGPRAKKQQQKQPERQQQEQQQQKNEAKAPETDKAASSVESSGRGGDGSSSNHGNTDSGSGNKDSSTSTSSKGVKRASAAAARRERRAAARRAASFPVDVHMEAGRMVRPSVSSLAAFWPAMQALIGLDADARALHANFTAAWAEFGWLPEQFRYDLTAAGPDAGHLLRPEHAEATYLLGATALPRGDRRYAAVAGRMLRALRHCRVPAGGYAPIASVATGELARGAPMESFFLSETAKYLFLATAEGAEGLVDWLVLSTEGHVLPVLPGPDDDGSEGPGGGAAAASGGADELSPFEGDYSGGDDEGGSDGGEGPEPGQGAPEVTSNEPETARAAAAAATEKDGAAAAQSEQQQQQQKGDESRLCGSEGGNGGQRAGASRPQAPQKASRANNATTRADAGAEASPGAGRAAAPPPVPENCRRLCARPTARELLASRRRVEAALPLVRLAGFAADARRLQRRRCAACVAVTEALARRRPPSAAEQTAVLAFGGAFGAGMQEAGATPLAHVVCDVKVTEGRPPKKGGAPPPPPRTVSCGAVRPLRPDDSLGGIPRGSVVMQLARAPANLTVDEADAADDDEYEDEEEDDDDRRAAAAPPHHLLAAVEAEGGPLALRVDAARALFGPAAPAVGLRCLRLLAQPRARAWAAPHECPPRWWRASGDGANAGRCPSAARCAQLLHAADARAAAAHPLVTGRASGRARAGSSGGVEAAAQEPGHESSSSSSSSSTEAVAAPTDSQAAAPQQQQQQQQEWGLQGTLDAQDAWACGGDEGNNHDTSAAPVGLQWLPLAELNGDGGGGAAITAAGEEAAGSSSTARHAPCSDDLGGASGLRALRLALPSPQSGCRPPRNAWALRGGAALVSRGGCSFAEKVARMQAAGAAAVVVVNSRQRGGAHGLVEMARDARAAPEPRVPAVLVSATDGALLRWWAERRPVLVTAVRSRVSRRGGGDQEQQQEQQQQEQPKEEPKQEQQQQEQQQKEEEQQQQDSGSSSGSSNASPTHDIEGGNGHPAATGAVAQGATTPTPQQPRPGGRPPPLPLRVDVLLPGPTQLWLLERLGHREAAALAATTGGLLPPQPAARINEALRALMRDARATRLLERVANADASLRERGFKVEDGGGGGGGSSSSSDDGSGGT